MDKSLFQQFLLDVEQMRVAQNKYFRSRTNLALKEAKHLEGKVDGWILRFRKEGLFEAASFLEQGKIF
jgi:hypothetical protein